MLLNKPSTLTSSPLPSMRLAVSTSSIAAQVNGIPTRGELSAPIEHGEVRRTVQAAVSRYVTAGGDR